MSILKLSTPGVYVQEISTFPPSVAEVETAIPAFIGYTKTAIRLGASIKNIPTKINNFNEYVLFFGDSQQEAEDSIKISVTDDGQSNFDILILPGTAKSNHNMYYAVKHYFDNGGGSCYIASVGGYTALPGTPIKDDLILGINTIKDIDEVTILVVPECQVCDDYQSVVQAMIVQASDLKDRFAIIDPDKVTPKLPANPSGDISGDAAAIRNCTKGPEFDRYAAAYYPNLITNYSRNFDFDNLTIDIYVWTGPIPPPPTLVGKKMSDLGLGSVLYSKIKGEVNKQYIELPPSSAIAGIYARVDSSKGVWKSPANESISSVVGPSIPISNKEQEDLNIDPNSGKSINAIRTFPGYGTLVWGARTLNGNDNEWRYISVRRFFNMVEESIKKSSQSFVFEPNTISTWVKVQAMIENYLFLKWREGALAGAKPEQAYFVRVGLGSTMTSLDILEGRMNVEIGMAVARPAEFIVLKFSQMMQQS